MYKKFLICGLIVSFYIFIGLSVYIIRLLIKNNYFILDSEQKTFAQIEDIKNIKEKEYLTSDEISLLYQIKKDKLLELRTKKMLPYFQIEDNSKVLFKKKDIEEFMKKYTF